MGNTPTTEAKVFVAQESEADRYLPEGPQSVVVNGREAIAWVNIQLSHDARRGAVHLRFWDTGERRTIPTTGRPGFLAPTDRPNVVFVGQDKEVGTLDLASGVWTALAKIPDDHPRTMINDGRVVPGGRAVVFGTKDFDFKEPVASLFLYKVDDGTISILADRQTCSNGKVFHRGADGALVLYDIDTPRRAVTRYRLDVARSTLTPDGIALNLDRVEGFPDGMVDAGDRTVIIAFYNPKHAPYGLAMRFNLISGNFVEQFATLGSPRVTCPLLVQRDGQWKLILTTAVEGMPAEQRSQTPNAGDLFIADTELVDVPEAEHVRLT
jgi:sugar lactone lactonase YvrE